ncbi:hypothetical protein MetMK1DRAFT_00006790 [Metallosphaera yellowstonensis MK1]|uniref:Uncharacterized protein n=1 Tax=Metallosphaera yellowstonensis MK1 TaxID=671065 RepID=H2C1Q6_9CREN|nr:hypothetical protein MetMK1DRAFT_00006790 [Metallosphaera yellowstonensis MK1]
MKYLEENVKDYDQVITDVGSGLNVKRKGFLKLLRMILNNEISKVITLLTGGGVTGFPATPVKPKG